MILLVDSGRALGLNARASKDCNGPYRPFTPALPLADVQLITERAVTGPRPLVLLLDDLHWLLDDLHWADPATLAALAYLHRRSAVLSGAVIATVGAEEVLTSHQLHRLPASERVTLSPLSPEELAEAGLEHLHTPTHGHPRFLAAAMNAGDRGQVLASLGDVLLARCRAEGPEAYSLLVCASVLDQPLDPAVMARVTG
jgi:hypothetical protein